jgi:hypothetical protein
MKHICSTIALLAVSFLSVNSLTYSQSNTQANDTTTQPVTLEDSIAIAANTAQNELKDLQMSLKTLHNRKQEERKLRLQVQQQLNKLIALQEKRIKLSYNTAKQAKPTIIKFDSVCVRKKFLSNVCKEWSYTYKILHGKDTITIN